MLNDAFPLEVRGWDGVAFTLDAPPRRILPMNAAGVDALAVLVEPARVAALPFTADEYSTFPDRAAWDALPRFEEISAAALLELAPDLVVGHEWQGAGAAPHLRRAGTPILILPMPRTWADVTRELETIAAVVDARAACTRELAELERRREALAASAGPRAHLRVLGYSNYGTGGWAAGADTTVDLVIALAGMQNAAREAGLESFQEIDHERLLALDPDLLLVEVEDDGRPGPTETFLHGESVLASLSALRAGGLVRLPRRLHATTSFHVLEAAEALAAAADAWLARPR